MKSGDNIIGERINDLLKQQKLSQKMLAKEVGVTNVSISRYISGIRKPRGETLVRIANVLHTTPEYIVDCEDGSPEQSYYKVRREIERSARLWTQEQRADIFNTLFEQCCKVD